MIKKSEDLERMKFIMFNVEQLTLFNLFSKYNVSNEIDHFHYFQNHKKLCERDQNLLKNTIIKFTKKQKSGQISSDFRSFVDKRLYEILSLNLE
jgi:hypothetical protein